MWTIKRMSLKTYDQVASISSVRQTVYRWRQFSTLASLAWNEPIHGNYKITILNTVKNPRVTAKRLKASLTLLRFTTLSFANHWSDRMSTAKTNWWSHCSIWSLPKSTSAVRDTTVKMFLTNVLKEYSAAPHKWHKHKSVMVEEHHDLGWLRCPSSLSVHVIHVTQWLHKKKIHVLEWSQVVSSGKSTGSWLCQFWKFLLTVEQVWVKATESRSLKSLEWHMQWQTMAHVLYQFWILLLLKHSQGSCPCSSCLP